MDGYIWDQHCLVTVHLSKRFFDRIDRIGRILKVLKIDDVPAALLN